MKKFKTKKILTFFTLINSALLLTGCTTINSIIDSFNKPEQTQSQSQEGPVSPENEYVYPEIPKIYQTIYPKATDGIPADFFSSCADAVPPKVNEATKFINIKNKEVKIYLATEFSDENKQYIEDCVQFLNEYWKKIGCGTSFTLKTGSPPLFNWYLGDSIYIFDGKVNDSHYQEGIGGMSISSLGNPFIYMYSSNLKEYKDRMVAQNPAYKNISYEFIYKQAFVHEIMHACNHRHSIIKNGLMNAYLQVENVVEQNLVFAPEETRSFIYQYSFDRSFEGMYKTYCSIQNINPMLSYKQEFETKVSEFISGATDKSLKSIFVSEDKNYNIENDQIISMQTSKGQLKIVLNKDKVGTYEGTVKKNGVYYTFTGKMEIVEIDVPNVGKRQVICLKDYTTYYDNGEVSQVKDAYIVYTKYTSYSQFGNVGANWKIYENLNSQFPIYLVDKTAEYMQDKNLVGYKNAFTSSKTNMQIYIPENMKNIFEI